MEFNGRFTDRRKPQIQKAVQYQVKPNPEEDILIPDSTAEPELIKSNLVYAGPVSGAAQPATFRKLVPADFAANASAGMYLKFNGTDFEWSEVAVEGSSNYTLPIASSIALGGIRVGNNLTIDSNGILSAVTGAQTLQQTTDNGNTTTGQIILKNTAGVDSLIVRNAITNINKVKLGTESGGNPYFYLYDASGFKTISLDAEQGIIYADTSIISPNFYITSEAAQTIITSEATADRFVIMPDKSGTVAMLDDISSSVGTASNGITKDFTEFKLGGQLTEDTTIDADGNDFIIQNGGTLSLESVATSFYSHLKSLGTKVSIIAGNNSDNTGHVIETSHDGIRIKSANSDPSSTYDVKLYIERLKNSSNQDRILSQYSVDGKVGFLGIGSGLVINNGVLIATNNKLGTVTSVGITSSDITVSGSPITNSGTFSLSLPTVNSNVGTFNRVTVNAKGQVTAASNVSYLTSFTETDPVANAKTITLTAGAGMTIIGTAGQTLGNNPSWTIGHADTSSVSDIYTASGQVIDSILFDNYGHVTTVNLRTFDKSTLNIVDRHVVSAEFTGTTTKTLTLNFNDGSTPVTACFIDSGTSVTSSGPDVYTTSGTFNKNTGILTLNRNDGGTYSINLDGRYQTTNTDNYVNTVNFDSTSRVLTLGRTGSLGSLSTIIPTGNTDTFVTAAAFNTGSGLLTLTKNDTTTVTVNLDGRYLRSYIDTNDYVDEVNFDSSTGVLTLGRTGSLADLTTNLDGRYIRSISATSPILFNSGTNVISHATSGVTSGTYNNVTVNTYGHVVSGSTISYLTSESDPVALAKTITLNAGSGVSLTGTPTQALSTNPSWTVNANISSDNGLTSNTPSNVRLGGTLIQNTTIAGTIYDLNFTSLKSGLSTSILSSAGNGLYLSATNGTTLSNAMSLSLTQTNLASHYNDGVTIATTELISDAFKMKMRATDNNSDKYTSFEVTADEAIIQAKDLSDNNTELVLKAKGLSTTTTSNILYYNSVTGNVTYGPATAAGTETTITADNGLTANTSTNVRLGGTLIQNTTINNAGFNFVLNRTGVGNTLLATATSGTAFKGTSASGYGIHGEHSGTTGAAIYGRADNGANAGLFIVSPTSVDTVETVIRVERNTTGNAVAELGASIDYYLQNDSASTSIANKLVSKWTDPGVETTTSEFEIWGLNNGTVERKVAVSGNGRVTFDDYGIGSFLTGTPVYTLLVDADGKIMEGDLLEEFTESDPVALAKNITVTAGTGISISQTATQALSTNPSWTINSTITQYTDAMARGALTLTTNNTSGASTYNATTGVLNIPIYADQFTGTVTSFSAGNLSPLFTTSVSNATSTPALSFTLSNAPTQSYLGNIAGTSGQPSYITGGTLSKVDDTNVTLSLGGTPNFALLQPVSLTLGWTGLLSVPRGGTAIGSYSQGDMLYASASTTLSKLPIGSPNQLIRTNAGGTAPEWFTPTYISSLAHTHGIANSTGTQQFTFAVGDDIRFEGTGLTTVSFSSATKKITIGSSFTESDPVALAKTITLTQGTGVTITGTATQALSANPSWTINSSITQYTDEMAQDAVGNILTDSTSIDFTYNDVANTITASVVDSYVRGLLSGTGNISYNSSTGVISTTAISGITADNGLTANTSTNVRLGGTLLQNTTVDATSNYYLTLTGANTANGTLVVNNTGTGKGITVGTGAGTGVYVVSSTGNGVYSIASTNGTGVTGVSSTGNGVLGQTTSGYGVWGTADTGIAGVFNLNPSSTNTTEEVIRVYRATSGTAAAGIGGHIGFVNERLDGGGDKVGWIGVKSTNVTSGSSVGMFELALSNGSALTRKFAVASTGKMTADHYGVGSFTSGTPTYTLLVDASGNIMEGSIASGGTVTTFSAGNLSPLFTTSVSNPTTSPALSFTLSNAAANSYLGNNTGSSAAPSYITAGSLTKVDDTNVTLTLGGSPTTSLLNSTSLTLGWSGQLAISRGGTNASTANAAFNNLAPTQTGLNGYLLTTDGSNTSWSSPNGWIKNQFASSQTTADFWISGRGRIDTYAQVNHTGAVGARLTVANVNNNTYGHAIVGDNTVVLSNTQQNGGIVGNITVSNSSSFTQTTNYAAYGVYGQLKYEATAPITMFGDLSIQSGVLGLFILDQTAGNNVTNGIPSAFRSINYFAKAANIASTAAYVVTEPLQLPGGTAYTGTITNYYGIFISDFSLHNLTGATITNRYAIYQKGVTDTNFFRGNIVFDKLKGASTLFLTVDSSGNVGTQTITTGTVTSVGITSSDITVSGSPITNSGTITLTLPNVNSNVGTFNNVTVNAKGQVTAASNVSYLTSYTETSTLANVTGRGNTTSTGIALTENGNTSTSYALYLKRNTDSSPAGYLIQAQNNAANTNLFLVDVAGNTTATSFVKSGGTSSQFLKADGSVDTNSYYLASNPNGYTTNTGTVTSVGISGSDFSIGSSPVTTSGTITLALANVNSNVGTFNNVTVNAKGQVTAASNVSYLTSFSETDTLSSVTGRGNTSSSGILLTENGNSANSYALYLKRNTDTSPQGFLIQATNAAQNVNLFYVDISGNTTATSFIKSGGTSSQFLKADGSVDSTSYYAASNPSGYITASSSNTLTNKSGNISQWTNDSGYITASSSNTLTNKSGNISQWTNDVGYITSASLPTVNNGTLTLNVSGSGLSGSQTFTANQASNVTFTVTSNATTSATASTIVLRDGGGYITNSYFNSTDDTSSTGITYIMAKFGDNYLRSASAAKVQSFLGLGSMAYESTSTYYLASNPSGYITASSSNTLTNKSGNISQWTNDSGYITSSALSGYVTTTYNSTLNSDSRNSRGVTRLFRRDDDSDYSIQTHYDGSRWFIRGYNGDSFHAEARVAYSDEAGSVAWTNVSGRPSNVSSFTNDSGYITASSSNTLTNKSGNISQWTNDSGYITSASLPTVNNATLTLNVSGTGLSGSQTFTANQGSNATFTVTSNATSANTASAIVARDSNGDFTARYINATYFNASSSVDDGTALNSFLVGGTTDGYYRKYSGSSVRGFLGSGTANSSTYLRGDGTWATVPAGTTINNNADNRIITGSGTSNTLEAESGLTWDGSYLNVSGNASVLGTGSADALLIISHPVTGGYTSRLRFNRSFGNYQEFRYDGSSLYLKRFDFGIGGGGDDRFMWTDSGIFRAANDVVAYYSFSDKRLKTDINYLSNEEMLNLTMQFKPVTYQWIDNKDRGTEYGLIAQDVEKFAPYLVTETERMGDDFKSKRIQYEKIAAINSGAIKALKEEKDAEIAELRKIISDLQNIVNGLTM